MARIMRELELRALSKKAFRPKTTQSDRKRFIYPIRKVLSWMKAGMSPSSEPFTLMERQRNQRNEDGRRSPPIRLGGGAHAPLTSDPNGPPRQKGSSRLNPVLYPAPIRFGLLT